MANVKLIIRGKKNPSNLYVRFFNGKGIDISRKSNIFINPKFWDNNKCNYKNSSEIENRAKLHTQFEKIKVFILEKYNEAYMLGDPIDGDWLQDTITSFFKRPIQQSKKIKVEPHYVYYVPFAEWWIKEIAPTWKTEKNKNLSKRAIQQYNSFLKIIKSFDKKNKKIKDIDHDYISGFSDYLTDVEDYAYETAKRMIGRFKFFLNRAASMKIETDPSFKDRIYVQDNSEEVEVPYLNENEIERIFNIDFSNDDSMDNIRDNFIIGLWTGLRISDFNQRLDVSNIKNDFIKIKTKKTGSWVIIPLHPQVKQVLDKRFGNLPIKFSDKHFNESIKTICNLADIDEEIEGRLFNSEKKRKVYGVYPKYKLITSHTCRRSLCTNLYGLVPNNVITDIGGWADEKMMLHYMKRTKQESADIVKQIWHNSK